MAPGKRLADFTAPRTPVEERLSEIWASVLGIDRPGIHDNFFQSGGDSLKAAQVFSRLRRDFQVELPLQSLFERPTVAELAELVTHPWPCMWPMERRFFCSQKARLFRGGMRPSLARCHLPSSDCGSSTRSSPVIPPITCMSRCASHGKAPRGGAGAKPQRDPPPPRSSAHHLPHRRWATGPGRFPDATPAAAGGGPDAASRVRSPGRGSASGRPKRPSVHSIWSTDLSFASRC